MGSKALPEGRCGGQAWPSLVRREDTNHALWSPEDWVQAATLQGSRDARQHLLGCS